jgi:hypothetical protein
MLLISKPTRILANHRTKSAEAILNSIGRFASRTLAAHGTNNMQEISDSGD